MIPTADKAFESFTSCLSSGGGGLSFRDICRRIGIAPADMDEILIEETGLDGESVVAAFFDSFILKSP